MVGLIDAKDPANFPGARVGSQLQILSNLHEDNRVLNSRGLHDLHKIIGFSEIRFYCNRPSTGRTFHIKTDAEEVINFFMSISPSKKAPSACGTFSRFPDDDSIMAVSCEQWRVNKGTVDTGQWGPQGIRDQKLNNYAVNMKDHKFVASQHGWGYCDDNGENIRTDNGVWKWFVR